MRLQGHAEIRDLVIDSWLPGPYRPGWRGLERRSPGVRIKRRILLRKLPDQDLGYAQRAPSGKTPRQLLIEEFGIDVSPRPTFRKPRFADGFSHHLEHVAEENGLEFPGSFAKPGSAFGSAADELSLLLYMNAILCARSGLRRHDRCQRALHHQPPGILSKVIPGIAYIR
jgi:hypothetical protein